MSEEISSQEALLRRIPNVPNLWTEGSDGQVRVSSAAMSPSTEDGGLSVNVRRLLECPADPADEMLGESVDGVGLAEFFASVAYDQGLDVEHAPLPDNWAHANVAGFHQMTRNRAKRAQRELAKAAAWVRMPADAAPA